MKKWMLGIFIGLLVGMIGAAPMAFGEKADKAEMIDMKTWKHPVKEVFELYQVPVHGVQLAQNRTYPIFDISFPYPVSESYESSLRMLVEQIAQANAYWSFELIDRSQSIDVKVQCDRNNRVITEVKVNGSISFFDQTFEKRLSAIRSVDQLKSIVQDDLDGDNQTEYIVAQDNLYTSDILLYLVQWDGKKFVNRGRLQDQIPSIIHGFDHAEIVRLDRTNKKYIAVYMEVGFSGNGFSLFQWKSGRVEHLLTNAPTATGNGSRYLKDIDKDGITDSVSEFNYSDTQHHIIYAYHPFNQPKAVKYKVVYGNEQGKFVYPNTPTGVITNFIEDSSWSEVLRSEMKKLIVSDDVLKFNVGDHVDLDLVEYNGLELSFRTISNKNDVQVIECRDDFGEGEKLPFQFTMVKQNGLWKIKQIKPSAAA